MKRKRTNDVPCRARKAQRHRRVGGRRGSAGPLDLMIGFFFVYCLRECVLLCYPAASTTADRLYCAVCVGFNQPIVAPEKKGPPGRVDSHA